MGQRLADRRAKVLRGVWAICGIVAIFMPSIATSAHEAETTFVVASDDVDSAARAVERLGGHVLAKYESVGTIQVSMTRAASARLVTTPGIRAVASDDAVVHASVGSAGGVELSLSGLATVVRADTAWAQGATGHGVDVALIDTGVANELFPVGRVVDGADVSASAEIADQRGQDPFGHGTHLAGVILAIAPNARVIDVKAGDHNGATTLSTLVRALEWTVLNARTDGRNIRVINLSIGAARSSVWDVLSQAVDSADRSGLLVVAAAGNGGVGAEIDAPAFYNKSLAVGATDTFGTSDISDDRVASFSSRGISRGVDIVAPGVAVSSMRVVGSHLDLAFPGARSGEARFRGSGTSQASATAAGVAALVASRRPNATPYNLRYALRSSARPLIGDTAADQGGGLIDAAAAISGMRSSLPKPSLTYWSVTSVSAQIGNAEIVDVQGTDWHQGEWSGNRWTGNRWTGNRWTGDGWPS